MWCVFKRGRRDGEHHWWETVLGLSATGIYNLLLHPVVIVLALSLLGLVLVIILYIRLWKLIMLFERLCKLC